MKYMVPSLVARCQSENDDVADQAMSEWEQACQDYMKHIENIRPHLTEGISALLDTLSLHDAQVLVAGLKTSHEFVMILRLGDHSGLILTYDIAEPLVHIRQPEIVAEGRVVLLYDEIELEEREMGRVFTHAMLFSSGFELKVIFHDVRVERIRSSAVDNEEFGVMVNCGSF
jgi:hypothetical protein